MADAHYIVKIESYNGEDTERNQTAQGVGYSTLYAVVAVSRSGATIVDDGYRSAEEAAAAWPEAIVSADDRAPIKPERGILCQQIRR